MFQDGLCGVGLSIVGTRTKAAVGLLRVLWAERRHLAQHLIGNSRAGIIKVQDIVGVQPGHGHGVNDSEFSEGHHQQRHRHESKKEQLAQEWKNPDKRRWFGLSPWAVPIAVAIRIVVVRWRIPAVLIENGFGLLRQESDGGESVARILPSICVVVIIHPSAKVWIHHGGVRFLIELQSMLCFGSTAMVVVPRFFGFQNILFVERHCGTGFCDFVLARDYSDSMLPLRTKARRCQLAAETMIQFFRILMLMGLDSFDDIKIGGEKFGLRFFSKSA